MLSSFIPTDERIVTIEDAAELQLHQDHVLRLESRPPNIEGKGEVKIRDLVKNSLRMRPDRIVVGEIRDAAALDMLQAMNTGHDGSISTLHANTPRDALARLETMVLMAGMDLPVRAIREQVASAVDLIVQQTRLKDGSRRITHVTEVEGMEGDIITLQDLFIFDYSPGFDDEAQPRARSRPPVCARSSSRSSRHGTCTSTRCSSRWTGLTMTAARHSVPAGAVRSRRRCVARSRCAVGVGSAGVRRRAAASTTSRTSTARLAGAALGARLPSVDPDLSTSRCTSTASRRRHRRAPPSTPTPSGVPRSSRSTSARAWPATKFDAAKAAAQPSSTPPPTTSTSAW